ncbi:MAG: hypothetical protein RI885_1474 [Actinomycetota bacterium]|jgi:predicted 3-demethylubiquinone-9 3-methyltransferase (glyoxalase superfamily)
MAKISPFLWFDDRAEEAANLYVSLFPDSRILSVSRYPEGTPAVGGSVMSVSMTLCGLDVQAFNGGPHFSFTEAVSLFVDAEDQNEIDRLWDALTAEGGSPSRCGWLTDRFGLSWQIVPPVLGRLLADPDPEVSARVMQAMLAMSKLNIAELERAAAG